MLWTEEKTSCEEGFNPIGMTTLGPRVGWQLSQEQDQPPKKKRDKKTDKHTKSTSEGGTNKKKIKSLTAGKVQKVTKKRGIPLQRGPKWATGVGAKGLRVEDE